MVVVVLSRIGWDARYRRQVLDTLVQSAAGSHSSRVLTGRLDEAPVGAAAPVSTKSERPSRMSRAASFTASKPDGQQDEIVVAEIWQPKTWAIAPAVAAGGIARTV